MNNVIMVIATHIHMNFRTDYRPGERLQQTVALVSSWQWKCGCPFCVCSFTLYCKLDQSHHWLKLLTRMCSLLLFMPISVNKHSFWILYYFSISSKKGLLHAGYWKEELLLHVVCVNVWEDEVPCCCNNRVEFVWVELCPGSWRWRPTLHRNSS